MEPRREKLSDLLHGNVLPAPPTKRALVFGTIAALLGAIAAFMAAYAHELRLPYLTVAIGMLVGIAILRARGHGKQLTLAAAVLTLLAIPLAYYLSFVLATLSWCTEKSHASMQRDAVIWQQLHEPSDEQVFAFAEQQGFAFTTRTAFDHYPGKMLTWFASEQPTLSEWRSWEYANSSFRNYLAYETGSLDYLLAVAAALLAAGIVHVRTRNLEDRSRQKALARRQEAVSQRDAAPPNDAP